MSLQLVEELTIPAPSETDGDDAAWQAEAERFIRKARLDGLTVTLTATGKTFSPAQVGRMVNTSKATVQRRIDDGTIAAVRVGARWLVSESEVDKYRHRLMDALAASVVDESWDD